MDNHYTFNVLVLGKSQAGKSSFIKKLLELSPYCEQEPPKVGTGGLRCTTRVKNFEVILPLTGYQLVETRSGKPVKFPASEKDVIEDLAPREDMKLMPEDRNPPHIRIRLIDTPGLDDSEGEDGEHILKVLKRLVEDANSGNEARSSISAVFIIHKANTAFTDGFMRMYNYYMECMPNLFRVAAMIHTNHKITHWEQDVDQYHQNHHLKSTFRSTFKQDTDVPGIWPIRRKRLQARRDAFFHQFNRYHRHFFVDSRPQAPFEDWLLRTELLDILNFIRAQGPMPITEMRLSKKPEWRAVDKVLASYLQAAGKDLAERQAEREKQAGTELLNVSLNVEELKAEIAQIDIDIKPLDSSTAYPLEIADAASVGFWSKTGSTMSFSGVEGELVLNHEKDKYGDRDLSGFKVTKPECDNSAVYEESQGRTVWRGKYRAKWGKTPTISASSSIENRLYYAKEIRALRSRRADTEARLQRNEAELRAKERSNSADVKAQLEVKQLGLWSVQCSQLVKKLSRSVIPLTRAGGRTELVRYDKEADKIDQADLYRFVRAEQPGLVEGLILTGAVKAFMHRERVYDDSDQESAASDHDDEKRNRKRRENLRTRHQGQQRSRVDEEEDDAVSETLFDEPQASPAPPPRPPPPPPTMAQPAPPPANDEIVRRQVEEALRQQAARQPVKKTKKGWKKWFS